MIKRLSVFSTLTFSTLLMLGCSFTKSDGLSLSSIDSGADVSNCVINDDNHSESAPCLLQSNASNTYYNYSSAFGGRTNMSTQNSLSPTLYQDADSGKNYLKAILPTGWSDNSSLNVNLPADYVAANILTGITLFGLAGSLSIAKTVCSGNPTSGRCWVAAGATGKYVYSTANNGRSTLCTIDSDTAETTACFANSRGENLDGVLYVTNVSNLPPSCSGYRNSSTGVITLPSDKAECSVPTSNYYYNDLNGGGGRQVNCNMSSSKYDTACWYNPCVKLSDGSTSCTAVQMNFNGTVVSNSCLIDTNTANSNSCQVIANYPATPKYVYTDKYGGRYTLSSGKEVYCLKSDNAGNCFLNTNKLTLSGLSADKIKANVSIFGIYGTYYASGEWGSGAAREPNIQRMDLSEEAIGHAGSALDPYLPTGYHEIPMFYSSSDGSQLLIDDDGSSVYPVDRSTWGTVTCGLSGTIAARVSDCGLKISGGVWDGLQKGNAGQGKWTLVSRSGVNKEVWRDESTGMIWSSLVASSLNWCKAAGSSNSANVSVSASLIENDPDDICDNSSYQKNGVAESVISACFEATGFSTTDAKINNTGKSGLSLTSTPNVYWRLPTLYDYQLAEYHGIRFVLPDMGYNLSSSNTILEWTGTINSLSSISEEAWAVDSKHFDQSSNTRSAELAVRCIGR